MSATEQMFAGAGDVPGKSKAWLEFLPGRSRARQVASIAHELCNGLRSRIIGWKVWVHHDLTEVPDSLVAGSQGIPELRLQKIGASAAKLSSHPGSTGRASS